MRFTSNFMKGGSKYQENTTLLSYCITHYLQYNRKLLNKYLTEYNEASILELDTIEDIIDENSSIINTDTIIDKSKQMHQSSTEDIGKPSTTVSQHDIEPSTQTHQQTITQKDIIDATIKAITNQTLLQIGGTSNIPYLKTIRWKCIQILNKNSTSDTKNDLLDSIKDEIIRTIRDMSIEPHIYIIHILHCLFHTPIDIKINNNIYHSSCESEETSPDEPNRISLKYEDNKYSVNVSDTTNLIKINHEEAVKIFNSLDIDLYNSENIIDRQKLITFLQSILPDKDSELIHQIIDVNKEFLISIDNIKQYLLTLTDPIKLDKYNFLQPGEKKKSYEITVKYMHFKEIKCKLIFVKNVWKVIGTPIYDDSTTVIKDKPTYIFNITLDPSMFIYGVCINDINIDADTNLSVINTSIRDNILRDISNIYPERLQHIKDAFNTLNNSQFTQFNKFYNDSKDINKIHEYIINSKNTTSECIVYKKIVLQHSDGQKIFNNLPERDILMTKLKTLTLFPLNVDNIDSLSEEILNQHKTYTIFIKKVREILTRMGDPDQNNIRMFREVLNLQKADGYKWSNTLESWKKRDFILYNFKLYYFKTLDSKDTHRYSQLRGIIDMRKSVEIFQDCIPIDDEDVCENENENNTTYTVRIKNESGIYKILFYTYNAIVKAIIR